mgnify:CR=1 FL=1|jgi:hypothetical protein
MSNDATRFRFIEMYQIKSGIRSNGYWKATAEGFPWVSRKTLAECIDILMEQHRTHRWTKYE